MLLLRHTASSVLRRGIASKRAAGFVALGAVAPAAAVHNSKCSRDSSVISVRQHSSLSQGSQVSFTPTPKGLQLTWPGSNTTAEVPFIWLRDHCRCSECYNSWTFQRLVNTLEIPSDITPNMIDITDNGHSLRIVWPDGHTSTYSASWLEGCSLGDKSKDRRTLWDSIGYNSQVFWDGSAFSKPDGSADRSLFPSVDFSDVSTKDEGLYEYLNKIRIYGFCVMNNVPTDDPRQTDSITERIGQVRDTFYGKFYENKIIPDGNDTAYSDIALPGHTDGCYWNDQPGLQTWHCHTPATVGGETLLIDGFHIGSLVRKNHPDTFDYLCKTEIPFGFRDRDRMLLNYGPVFTLDQSGNLIHFRYNNDDRAVVSQMSCSEMEEFYHHLKVFLTVVRDPVNFVWCKLEKGDLLTIFNRRVLHGRNEFNAESGRYLRGCYHSFEDYHSQLRHLENKLGIFNHESLV